MQFIKSCLKRSVVYNCSDEIFSHFQAFLKWYRECRSWAIVQAKARFLPRIPRWWVKNQKKQAPSRLPVGLRRGEIATKRSKLRKRTRGTWPTKRQCLSWTLPWGRKEKSWLPKNIRRNPPSTTGWTTRKEITWNKRLVASSTAS